MWTLVVDRAPQTTEEPLAHDSSQDSPDEAKRDKEQLLHRLQPLIPCGPSCGTSGAPTVGRTRRRPRSWLRLPPASGSLGPCRLLAGLPRLRSPETPPW